MSENNKSKKQERRDTYQIVLIGTGGTGGMFASLIARYIYSKKDDKSVAFSLSLVDADRVSESNVNRQPFTAEDVNQFKVDCLNEAFTELYDIKVTAFPQYIDKPEDLTNIINSYKPNSFSNLYEKHEHIILVGGVDNHRARQVMHEYFSSWKGNDYTDLLYIDSANEFDFGTCVCGYRTHEGEFCPPRAFFFRDVLTDTGKSASEMSCGEINVSAPQHLVTNMAAANTIFSKICLFVDKHEVSGGVTSFYPFVCSSRHMDMEGFGISDYHKIWLEYKAKQEDEGDKNGRRGES